MADSELSKARAEGRSAYDFVTAEMAEPPVGSVLLRDGPTGTAWQRHAHDGLWHSTTGATLPFGLLLHPQPGHIRPLAVVYVAPEREN